MLSNSGLSKDFWAEAINMAGYLVNRSPSTAIESKTHFEVWSGTPTDYSNLRVFGCPTYTHMNDGKLEPRARAVQTRPKPDNPAKPPDDNPIPARTEGPVGRRRVSVLKNRHRRVE